MENMVFDKVCCVKGCDLPSLALGLCNKHWRRTRKFGSPVAVQMHSGSFKGIPARDRFFMQVRKHTDGCWEWVGGKAKNGYGSFRGEQDGVLHHRAHRYSYHYHKGVIPDDMMVCHTCDNPCCVNPAHLFLGSAKDNMQDKIAKGRARIPQGEKSHYAKLTEEQVLSILKDPRPHAQIAHDLGGVIGSRSISDIKRKVSWKYLDCEAVHSKRISPNKGKSEIFTEEDIRLIRSSDRTGKELAELYRTTPQTICDIRKRRSWKHVA